jgi:hypothetical protein
MTALNSGLKTGHSAFDQDKTSQSQGDAVAENADEDRQLRLERQRAARHSSALGIADLLPDLFGPLKLMESELAFVSPPDAMAQAR